MENFMLKGNNYFLRHRCKHKKKFIKYLKKIISNKIGSFQLTFEVSTNKNSKIKKKILTVIMGIRKVVLISLIKEKL